MSLLSVICEHILYPELMSGIAESVYLLAMERNPNVVRMSSYRPSFHNINYLGILPARIPPHTPRVTVEIDTQFSGIKC